MERNRVAIDCETFLIGQDAIYPQVVCVSMSYLNKDGGITGELFTDAQPGTPQVLLALLEDEATEIVGHNIEYDLHCIRETWPELVTPIWKALMAGRITDTMLREKLLNLSTHGKLDRQILPDESTERLSYSLESLAMKYLGVDLSKEKKDPDSWRLKFDTLSGKMPEEYPKDAYTYAVEDAELTFMVAYEQDKLEQSPEGGPASMKTQFFQTTAAYALGVYTKNGFHIDQEEVAKVEAMLEEELAPDKMQRLLKSGVLRPAEPPRPFKRGGKNPDGTVKMTQGKNASINKAVLMEVVRVVSEDNGIEVQYTDASAKFPDGQISTDSAIMEELAPLDPILGEYQRRQKVLKLKTSYIPNLQAGTVHASYDVLKETGRTSSYGNKLYPSWNGQQVDPRVRPCCIARPGHVLVSSDYHAIELVSLGQKIYSLFGSSTLRDLIMDGVDPHAYLGAQLAFHLDEDFRNAIQVEQPDPAQSFVYSCFMECKESDADVLKTFFKHYRKLAKPVGLGYPGGLGPETCMGIAKEQYGIEEDLETFVMLREVWHETFPEMKPYFEWINKKCVDPADADAYSYTSPLGMYRAGASYCAAANGAALQTPTAEGAKYGVIAIARACDDPAAESILYECRPLLFIHDENIVEVPEGDLSHARGVAISKIMEEQMRTVLEDMHIKAEPCLMQKWYKEAEPTFDAEGLLIPWEPKS